MTTTDSESTAPAPEATTDAPKAKAPPKPKAPPKAEEAPEAGEKFSGTYEEPTDLVVVGHDTPAPEGGAAPIFHRVHQPERLAEIKRQGVMDLVETIIAAGSRILMPVVYLLLKLDGKATKVVLFGRRRKMAADYINANLAEINKERKAKGLPLAQHVLVPAIKGDPNDPNLWVKIRSENAGRMEESPLAVAADVALMLEGDPVLGVPKMTHEQIGALYGKTHQFSRAMAKLDKASDKVKAALRKGQLKQTAAQEISTLKTHEEQDAALEEVLADGGTAKSAKAKKSKAKGTKTSGATPKSVKEVREAIRGLEDEITKLEDRKGEASKRKLRELVAAHGALRWAIGEDELEGEDDAEELWLVVANAQSKGEGLLKLDRESATAADRAAAQAERDEERAKKEAAEKERKDKAAKRKADRDAAKAKAAK